MDMFDGRYSRMSGKGTKFGAFLDSTLDRVEEGVVLAAIATYFAKNGDEVAVGAVVLTIVGSYMVSYTRARAEALGVECKVGVASRAVRVVILSAGLVFAKGAGLGGLRAAGARHLRDGRVDDARRSSPGMACETPARSDRASGVTEAASRFSIRRCRPR